MLERAKYYYENDKIVQEIKQEMNTGTYLKKKKIKKENMEKTDPVTCLKKRKTKKISKKLS